MSWPLAAAAAAIAALALLGLARARRRRDETRAWVRGVGSVLSDDSDAAIAALSDAARLGREEAIDTYLALGALFRRTGELARAVRLHRNMLVYPGLDDPRRAEIERELAEDYRRSGMLAEAEELLRARVGADRASAGLLREVLADQGRWTAAAEVERGLHGAGPDPVLAHLLAAAARGALEAGRDGAAALARDAVAADAASADARLAFAEVEARAGRSAEAVAAARGALALDPRAGVLAWPALARVADRELALRAVDGLAAASPGDPALQLLRGRLLLAGGRNSEALEAFRAALEADARGEVVVAMRDLLRTAPPPGPEELAARHDLLASALLKKARPPRCGRCGAEAPAPAWRCRSCGAFETLLP